MPYGFPKGKKIKGSLVFSIWCTKCGPLLLERALRDENLKTFLVYPSRVWVLLRAMVVKCVGHEGGGGGL